MWFIAKADNNGKFLTPYSIEPMTLEAKKKYPKLANNNEMYTPPEAVQIILPFLPKDKVYREACYGMWHFAQELTRGGVEVVWHKDIDCLTSEPEQNWDIWITNPPFNGNKMFVDRAIELWKPFVFLMRLEHLWGVDAYDLLHDLDIQILIPKRRINYIKRMDDGTLKQQVWIPFHSIFITRGMNLPKQIMYI